MLRALLANGCEPYGARTTASTLAIEVRYGLARTSSLAMTFSTVTMVRSAAR